MANKFDTSEYPTNVPDILYVGDSWNWKRTFSDYPPSAYALSYSFRLLTTAATEISFSINESGDDYLIQVNATTTVNHTAGDYTYQEYITKSATGERIVYSSGLTTVKSNLDADTSDPRSHERIVLDALLATLENRASIDQMSMSIAGRSLSRMSPEELITWKSYYQHLVLKEDKKSSRGKGESTGNVIKVQF